MMSRSFLPARGRSTRASLLVAAPLFLLVAFGVGCGDDDDGGGGGGPIGPGGGTASISGVVISSQDFFGASGVTVSVEPFTSQQIATKAPLAATVTDRQGSFTLGGLGAGTYWLTLDGRSSGPGTDEPFPPQHYARHRRQVQLAAGQALVFSDPIYLPYYIDEFFRSYDGSAALTLQQGPYAVLLPEGTVTYPDVLTPERIGMIQIFADRTPVPLPTGLAPSSMVAVEPAGTTFDPAVVRVFNDFGAQEGATIDIVGLDPVTSSFTTLGTATLQEDGWFESDAILDAATVLGRACPAHTLVGRVVNTQQQGVPGVEIQVTQPQNVRLEDFPVPGMKTVTDDAGEFAFSGLRTCVYGLRAIFVSDAGTTGFILRGLHRGETDTTDVGDLLLDAVQPFVWFDIAGTVRRVDGTPVGGAAVNWGQRIMLSRFPSSFGELITGSRGPVDEASALAGGPVVTGPDGSYRLASLTSPPEQAIGVFASASDYFNAPVDTTAPGLPDNGTTLEIDLTVCPFPGSCVVGNWALDGSTIRLSSDTDVCSMEDESMEVTVIALTDGRLTIEVTEGDQVEVWTLERVQGTGPSGISQANLAGLYRVARRGTSTGPPWEYVGLRSDARVVRTEGYDVQSGTFSLDGQRLLLDPAFVDGRHGPLVYDVSVLGDRLVLVSLTGDVIWNMVQCEGAGDGSLDGIWTLDNRGVGSLPTFVFQGDEYAMVINGFLGGPRKASR